MAQETANKKGVTINRGDSGDSSAGTGPYVKDEVFTSEETTNQLRVSEEDFFTGAYRCCMLCRR